jgi:hypothetical protein
VRVCGMNKHIKCCYHTFQCTIQTRWLQVLAQVLVAKDDNVQYASSAATCYLELAVCKACVLYQGHCIIMPRGCVVDVLGKDLVILCIKLCNISGVPSWK